MEDEYWDWGPADRSYVDTCLNNESDGSFLVFHDQDTNQLVLGYRHNDRNVYKYIIFKDHYYGFTEPLGFESLGDLLNAYNWSPATEDVLVTPLHKPSELGEEPVNAVYLLLKIRENDRQIEKNSLEINRIMSQVRQTDAILEELQLNSDGLSKVLRMIDIQIQRHNDLSKRVSVGSLCTTNTDISDNYSLLLERQRMVQDSKREKEALMAEAEQERRDHLKEYNACMFAVNDIEEQLAEDKRLLIWHHPNIKEYIDFLLQGQSISLPGPNIYDIRSAEATKHLQGRASGTFLVRVSRKSESIPFVLSVCLDGEVVNLPVYQMSGYYGFNETLCIFESLQDLVNNYAKIPLRFHGARYGDLKLCQEVVNFEI